MRAALCFVFIIFYSILDVCFAQPDTLWTQRISSFSSVNLIGATALSDGGFALAGVCTRGGSQDVLLCRLSAGGTIVWANAYGDAASNEQANAVVEMPDHSLMVIGQSASSGQSSRTFLVMGIGSQGDSLWTNNYTVSTGLRKGMDAVALGDGNVAALGYALGRDAAHSDLWLLKLDASGDTVWTRMYGGTDIDTGSRLALAAGGNLVLVGQTRSFGAGDYDVWVVNTTSGGDSINSSTFGTSAAEKAFGLGVGHGKTFVGGRIQSSGGNADGYLVAMDSVSFPSAWAHVYDSGMPEDQISGVAARPGGGAVCAGWSGVSTANTRPWLFRVNDEGTLEQSWIDSTGQQGQFTGIIANSTGGYLAWGTVTEDLTVKGYIVMYAPTGELTGSVHDLTSGHVVVGAHVGLADGSEFATTNALGRYSLELRPGTYDLAAWGPCISRQTMSSVTIALDSTTLGDFNVGSPDYECDQSSVNLIAHNHQTASAPLSVLNPGTGALELWVTTQTQTPGNWLSVDPAQATVAPGDSVELSVNVHPDTTDEGMFDFFGYVVVHTFVCPDSVESVPVVATVLAAANRSASLPTAFALDLPFPNPFNPSATIGYAVPRSAFVSLTVYDVTGRRVATLISRMQTAGLHRVIFDGGRLASGVYWVQMNAGDFSARQKLVLIK